MDLVYDKAQQEVVQEIQVVEGVREILNKTVEKATEQIRLLRKTAYTLKEQLKDKEESLIIDEYAKNLHIHRPEVKRQARLLVSEFDE